MSFGPLNDFPNKYPPKSVDIPINIKKNINNSPFSLKLSLKINTLKNDKDKKISPCEKCNYNNQTFFYLVGQIWVDDEYEPIIEPDDPQ